MSDDIEKKLEVETQESVSSTTSEKFVQSPEEKRLVKKIDKAFIPFVCVVLFLQFIDKTTINTAAGLTLLQDTHITQDQYSWVASIFYLGYLVMQPLNNVLMQKFPISKYLGAVMVAWGITLALMSEAKKFADLAGLRFLLGFFEAVTYPSIFLLIATLYRRSEQVLWFGIMFMSNSMSTIIGGFIGYGISHIPTVGTITAWKWGMIIFGSLTSLAGVVFFFFLPDNPYSRWFHLEDGEKEIIEERTRDNAVVSTYKLNMSQIYEALREPRFYCYCFVSLLINLQNGALTTFSTIIIKQLGFNTFEAILLNIPAGVCCIIIICVFVFWNRKTGGILYPAMGAGVCSTIGMICLTAIPGGGVKLIGFYLSWGCTALYLLQQASIAANVSGYTKKIFYTSGNLVFYTFGNFIGPLMLVAKQQPRYFGAMGGYLGANIVCLILLFYIRWDLVQRNKRRNADKKHAESSLVDGLEDLTDVQNIHFVYKP
ncbi:MFS general substrate transporter [Backusella circina FSU 941]|nr:MFS general substrate transporter [Backusella circina FSU 941]